MKKLIFLIVILALAAANAFAARIYPAEGRVVDEQGQAVEYATVVLLKGSDQVADRKSTRLNSSHYQQARMPSSA